MTQKVLKGKGKCRGKWANLGHSIKKNQKLFKAINFLYYFFFYLMNKPSTANNKFIIFFNYLPYGLIHKMVLYVYLRKIMMPGLFYVI